MLRPATVVWTQTSQDDGHTFQVFSMTHDGGHFFQYCGEYTAVHNVTIEYKWANLPAKVRMLNLLG